MKELKEKQKVVYDFLTYLRHQFLTMQQLEILERSGREIPVFSKSQIDILLDDDLVKHWDGKKYD